MNVSEAALRSGVNPNDHELRPEKREPRQSPLT